MQSDVWMQRRGAHFSDVLAKCCERFEVFCRYLGHAALDEDAAKGQTKDDDVNCNKSGNKTLRRRSYAPTSIFGGRLVKLAAGDGTDMWQVLRVITAAVKQDSLVR